MPVMTRKQEIAAAVAAVLTAGGWGGFAVAQAAPVTSPAPLVATDTPEPGDSPDAVDTPEPGDTPDLPAADHDNLRDGDQNGAEVPDAGTHH
ncbi:hypothetical protein ACFYTQ_35315 [Nocardia sp. NPDC004068]|uniref:hypothetical protein n=1 Tax=Nocardia sp. NPDC004068 TaxID=3364303 RepID=UPI0036D01D89